MTAQKMNEPFILKTKGALVMFTEWHYVRHTRGMLKIILGILLIPAFYAVIFLASLWNPYAKLDRLPVAVVNLDQPVISHHHRVALGQQLTHELVHNHEVDFSELSAKQTKQRLKSGQLYIAITIPKTFSARASQLATHTTTPIKLHYQTNAGFSFIAMKLDTTTVTQIQTKLDRQLNQSYLKAMTATLSRTGQQLTTAATDLQQTTRGVNQLTTGLQTTKTDLTKVATGNQQLATGLNQLAMHNQTLITALTQLAPLASQLQTGLNQQLSLQAQVSRLTQQLNTDLQATRPNLTTLRATDQQLQTATTQLHRATLQPAGLASRVTITTNELATGVKPTQTALATLATGATTLQTTTNQLATGGQALTTGAQKVATVDARLADHLRTGGHQLTQASRPTASQLATLIQPIQLTHTDPTRVQNNGTGMSPYLMAVALFVGCITFNIIYDMSLPHRQPRSAWDWWRLKMPFLFEFTWLAATVMYVGLLLIDHLNPLHPLVTYAMCVLTMWTFGSMVTWFNQAFGKTGAWLMLLFMIIQLGGAAGTYPIQLSNQWFQAIHPYLPMSIAIDAFRSTVSIGNSIIPELIIFGLIILAFNLLTLLTFYRCLPQLRLAQK